MVILIRFWHESMTGSISNEYLRWGIPKPQDAMHEQRKEEIQACASKRTQGSAVANIVEFSPTGRAYMSAHAPICML